MKVVNICLTNPYSEKFSYQENLLTDYFRDASIDTTIIASTRTYVPKKVERKKIKAGLYDDAGKKLIRIKNIFIGADFVIPFGLLKNLIREKPEIIFHHNLNFSSLIIIALYRLFNRETVLFVDNHADYINCSKNKLWRFLYHKNLLKLAVRLSTPQICKYYGVTPLRCDYLSDVFDIKQNKIDFLPIGTDTKTADLISENKEELRNKYNITQNAFIFISGGKMGKNKGTDYLIEAVKELRKRNVNALLILFGTFNDEETEELAKKHDDFVILKGWQNHQAVLELLKLADVAVWPVHHTTLIEDAISVNTPLIIRKTRTTEHLIENNGIFIHSTEYEELLSAINKIYENYSTTPYSTYSQAMREKLDYRNIVKKIMDDAEVNINLKRN